MPGRLTIKERDVQTLLRVVHAPDSEDPGEPLPSQVLLALKDMIGCDVVNFCQFDAGLRLDLLSQAVSDVDLDSAVTLSGDPDFLDRFWPLYWTSACSYPERSGDLRAVTRISDHYADRRWRSSRMYAEYCRYLAGDREMMVCLPSPTGRILRLVFWRGPGRDFTERDRGLLTLLRPHLYELYRRRQQRTLTVRQIEILNLVAVGCTNGQVARRLNITEATVRKHLENIFDRLQVTSRTAAVSSAFGHPAQDNFG